MSQSRQCDSTEQRSAATQKQEQRVRYELHADLLEDLPYTIKRVEIIGPFATRAEARQHMIDTIDERKERDA